MQCREITNHLLYWCLFKGFKYTSWTKYRAFHC